VCARARVRVCVYVCARALMRTNAGRRARHDGSDEGEPAREAGVGDVGVLLRGAARHGAGLCTERGAGAPPQPQEPPGGPGRASPVPALLHAEVRRFESPSCHRPSSDTFFLLVYAGLSLLPVP
jgi:hypothetical protein